MNLVICRTDFKNNEIFEDYLFRLKINKKLWHKIIVIILHIDSDIIEMYNIKGNAISQNKE